MSTILDQIVATKRREVAQRKALIPQSELPTYSMYQRPTRSLRQSLEQSAHYGIIAEFKRKSPSQSDINLLADPVAISEGYTAAGAAAMSVLTDRPYFGAHYQDFEIARSHSYLPMIRKDFIVDAYQIYEARAMGADAILLIAACLEATELDHLANIAKSLDLEVLCEIHDEEELSRVSPAVDVVGVNNRNLKDFKVSLSQSLRLADKIPAGMLKISESGIEDAQSIVRLRQEGFAGFLIGTYFMRQTNPGAACAAFIEEIRTIEAIYKDAIA